MEEAKLKIKRSRFAIKCFMALVVLLYAIQTYQTGIIDFGAMASHIGILLFLRALVLSPQMLSTPIKVFTHGKSIIHQESYKYLVLAFVFFVIGAF